MIHPKTELKYISEAVGFGVVATDFIPAGTITWVLDELDQEFSPLEFELMAPVYQTILETYSYRNNLGNFILCWDNARFVNHSFNSNCLTTAYDFEIAIRDIEPGEQLTDDYGYLNIQSPFRAMDEGTERKIVYPNDLLKYHNVWDKKIENVFGRIILNEQPLKTMISNELWTKMQLIIAGKTTLASILDNYYDEQK